MNEYKRLAESILQTNDLTAYEQMQSLLTNFKHVEAILCEEEQNESVLFVFCEIFSKNLLHERFDALDDAKSDRGDCKIVLSRMKKYAYILDNTIKMYLAGKINSRVGRSLKNLICVCLKCIIEGTTDPELFVLTLRQFFPSFAYDQAILKQDTTLVYIVNPIQAALPPQFIAGIEIMTDIVDYLTTSGYSKSYYVFRRNIYTFRNSYLPILLTIAIGYGKLLLREGLEANLIKSFVKFLYTIIMYPFSISTHDLNSQEALFITETYFPVYFRSIVCDEAFVDGLGKLYVDTVRWGDSQLTRQCTQLLGRLISANQYLFNSEEERINTRIRGLGIGKLMLTYYTYLNFPYLNSLITIHKCILTIYAKPDFGSHYTIYIQELLNFIKNIIVNAEIIIQEGKNNPITQALILITENIMTHMDSSIYFKQQIDNILQTFFNRLQDNNQMMRISELHPWSREEQLDKFYEFFEPLVSILYLAQPTFLNVMEMLPVHELNQAAQIFWMYLASYILPSSSASERETQIIFKFFREAQKFSHLACLQFLNQTLQEMLSDMNEMEPKTSLWLNFQPLIRVNFKTFLQKIVEDLFNILRQCQDEKILQGTLKIFNTIYRKLRKSGIDSKQNFYTMIKHLLVNINQTIFDQSRFYKIRISFMEIVSIIWINFGEYQHIVEIYQLAVGKVKENSSAFRFIQYLNDLTGFISPIISPKSFKTLLQLIFPDLEQLINVFLQPQQCQELFKIQYALKSYLKFVNALINGFHGKRFPSHPHSSLPINIYYLLRPTLEQVLKFDYPGLVVEIWQEIPSLNPLGELLPIHEDMSLKNGKQYIVLLRMYSQNLHQLVTPQALYSFYPFIKDKLEILSDWWMEVIERELHPDINVKQIVDARIWNRPRQQTILGKLLYTLGRYDSKYWPVPYQTEEEFVKEFLLHSQLSNSSHP